MINRRTFLEQSLHLAASISLINSACSLSKKEPLFKISLAEWSLHRTLFGDALKKLGWEKMIEGLKKDSQATLTGEIDNLDFPIIARQKFGIDAVEYVNQFFLDKARDIKYLKELKKRADNEGVKNVLIMCDLEGKLGAQDDKERIEAVENHYKWIDAAKYLGCHSIRVNAHGEGSYEEQQKRVADSLSQLAEYGDNNGINVLVENHGGLSSNSDWLTGVMKKVNHPRVGTLPDFGNFSGEIDIYQSVKKLMRYAKAVSAKSANFNENGTEKRIDYFRMMKIVLDAGYRGYVGIEYGGSGLSEFEGILATKKLLEQVREQLRKEYA